MSGNRQHDPDAERFEKFVKARTERPPRLLFKYTTLETARLIIANRQLRFSSPLEFNDPFDVQWNALWQTCTPEFSLMLAQRVVDPTTDLSKLPDEATRKVFLREREAYHRQTSDDERERFLKVFAQRLHDDRDYNETGPLFEILKRLRVLCLTADGESVLMWSYYGAHHRGATLAFDTEALEQNWRRPVEKVEYRENFPEILDPMAYCDHVLFIGPAPEWDMDRATTARVCTKAAGWSHEHEWRFVHKVPPGAPGLHDLIDFPISACVGMAAGCNTDMGAFRPVARMLVDQNPRATIVKINRHPTQFGLRATPSTL